MFSFSCFIVGGDSCTMFRNRIKVDLFPLKISNPFRRKGLLLVAFPALFHFVLFFLGLVWFVLIFVSLTFDTFNQVRVAAYR